MVVLDSLDTSVLAICSILHSFCRLLTSGSVEQNILERAKQKMVLDHLPHHDHHPDPVCVLHNPGC